MQAAPEAWPGPGWFISLPDATPPQPCYEARLGAPDEEHTLAATVAFNSYLADHNDAHEVSIVLATPAVRPGRRRPGSRRSARAAEVADDDHARGTQEVILIQVWYSTFMLDFICICYCGITLWW